MFDKIWKTIRKPIHLQSDCLHQHRNQVASEFVHGANLAVKCVVCNACVEENKQRHCKCNHSIDQDLESTAIGDVGIVEHDAEANSSFAHAVINMVGMLIGLGQLSTPYALETGGWASAFLLIGLGVICAYTSHLLGKCLDKNPKSRSYSDIGWNAFGRRGRILAATFIYMEIFMALVSYTISLHDNIRTIFLGTRLRLPWAKLSTPQLLTVTAVLVALPSLWLRNLSSISFLSSGGILMSMLIFVSVASTAVFGGVKANHKIPVLQLLNIPTISGLYIFSYAGHIVFPNLYKAMKDPSKFTKVSIVSFGLVTTLYASLGFMGAKLFGPQVNPQITLSMPPHYIMTKIALWATVLTPMTKYALEFAPFAIQLEHNILPSSMSSRTKLIIRGCFGSILLLVILALALSVPYFEYVLSLTGSLVSVMIAVILPCAFYIKICWGQISKPHVLLNLILITIGSLLGVLGTISSSKMLLKNLQGAHAT
ncbi:Vacuolar amino acid transporter like [Quillaja saponaria]|uniref:Vacuolar amino acid transporter like n=1 Tax=Quillaja saponaria TaxID=32244 RepID=A0AAD7PIY5_QUISA|nr:Vacuolar amino acid transporter like [Quillaja saponaria]